MLTSKQEMKLAKTVCYALRHKPQDFKVDLDSHGYASINDLLDGINFKEKKNYSYADIEAMVDNDNKGRYKVVGNLIRCQFGHSVEVELESNSDEIPEILLHGTASRNIDSIMKDGLKSKSRNKVHLTSDIQVARNVGLRYAKSDNNLAVLQVDSKGMKDDGLEVVSTGTSTYLSESVPAKYITIL